jgi:hypothetical protein
MMEAVLISETSVYFNETTRTRVCENLKCASFPGSTAHTVFCGVTTVRLVSSGRYDNRVTVAVREAADDDIVEGSLMCGL